MLRDPIELSLWHQPPEHPITPHSAWSSSLLLTSLDDALEPSSSDQAKDHSVTGPTDIPFDASKADPRAISAPIDAFTPVTFPPRDNDTSADQTPSTQQQSEGLATQESSSIQSTEMVSLHVNRIG